MAIKCSGREGIQGVSGSTDVLEQELRTIVRIVIPHGWSNRGFAWHELDASYWNQRRPSYPRKFARPIAEVESGFLLPSA